MAKDLFPNTKFTEEDRTLVVRTAASSIGAMAGRFTKGPVGRPILIGTKGDLISNFGTAYKSPSGTVFNNLEDWYTVNNFLSYAAGIYVLRVEHPESMNANKNFEATASTITLATQIKDGYDMSTTVCTNSGLTFIAKNPGTWGNYIQVAFVLQSDVYDDGNYYDYEMTITTGTAGITDATTGDYLVASNGALGYVKSMTSASTYTVAYNGTTFASASSVHEGIIYVSTTASKRTISAISAVTTKYYNNVTKQFPSTMGTNDIAIIIYYPDSGGNYNIVERFMVSLTENAKTYDGKSAFIEDYLEKYSDYVSAIYNTSGGSNVTVSCGTATLLAGATMGTGTVSSLVVEAMDDNYRVKDNLLFDIIMDGGYAGNTTIMNNIISICEARKDCFGILSAGASLAVTTEAAAVAELKTLRNALTATTYAALYGWYKIQNDSFSGRTFNCSVSGDIAGIFARNDILSYKWMAPAGYNRGGILNVFNSPVDFSETNQSDLFPKQINLITKNQRFGGYYVTSQKTLTGRPSAFSDINVRRLFTYCENNITSAARSYLFDFNDEITRGNLYTIITNFLNNIKNNRGIYDFKVVCDTTNNTPALIDDNQLLVDVFIKPARAVNWVTLRFVATRTDANFDEITN